MSFTGTTQAAPTNVVDSAPAGCFTVVTPPTAYLPISDTFVTGSAANWTTLAGSPVFSAGVFSGGAVARRTDRAFVKVRCKVGTAPPAGPGEYIAVAFACTATLSSYYSLNATSTGWALYKNVEGVISSLDTYANVPLAGDTIEIRYYQGGAIEIDIDGTLALTATDTANDANGYVAVATNGTGTIAIDPTDNAYTVIAL